MTWSNASSSACFSGVGAPGDGWVGVVTVRARGVMEKCTFCVQRIRGAQHRARLEDREVAAGEIVTACAQACPSGALEFGNVHQAESRERARLPAPCRRPRAPRALPSRREASSTP